MTINIRDYQELLDSMSKMLKEGFHFVAFPMDEAVDSSNLSYFKTAVEAAEHCYEMSTDVDFYKSVTVSSVINALETVERMGQDTTGNKAIDIMAMAQTYRDSLQLSNDTTNNKVMNEKNFDYLKEQVKYTGFGEGLENDLKEKMRLQEPNFKLYHNAHYGNDVAVATLNFKKSDQSDMYFFNSYQVNLQKEHGKEIMEQTFYINKGNNITLKEAYNLMEGRAVNKDLTNKDGQVYNAWIQMNFTDSDSNGNFKLKQYHQNYGYDLPEAFGKQAMTELNDPKIYEDPDFINSLKKGNLQSVIVMKGDTSMKVYIEANPQFKSINVYDANMQRLDQRQAKGEKQGEGQEQSAKQTKKEGRGATEEGSEAPKEGQKKRSRQSNSM